MYLWLGLLTLFVSLRLLLSREWFLRVINSEQGIVERARRACGGATGRQEQQS